MPSSARLSTLASTSTAPSSGRPPELVQQYTATYPVGAAGHIYELNDVTLNELAAAEAPDTVKVVNLVKLLHDLVANERDTKPFLMSIGEKAEALAEAFRDRQVST